jgi:UDP-glucose 4-epimerase
MRVLISGGAGFIASHISDSIIANGHESTIIDDLSGGFVENVPSASRFVREDIRNAAGVDVVFERVKPEIVIHAGAYAAEGLSHFIRRYNYETNVIGSITLINAAVRHGCKGFVFLSSIATYGHQEPPFSEMTPLAAADPYAAAKACVEADLKAAHEMFGLPYIIFKPFNVYGPRQNIGDNYRNCVGIFFNQCLKKKPMTVFGDGEQTRAFSYIDDVAPAIAASIDMPECWGQTYNIGGTHPRTVFSLAHSVAEAMGVKADIEYLQARKEATHAYCDTHKARSTFRNIMPDVRLEQGLEKMAVWVKKHGARSTPKFANIEITKNLPPSWATL